MPECQILDYFRGFKNWGLYQRDGSVLLFVRPFVRSFVCRLKRVLTTAGAYRVGDTGLLCTCVRSQRDGLCVTGGVVGHITSTVSCAVYYKFQGFPYSAA